MSANGSFRAPPIEELQPHFPQYSIDAFVAVGGMGAVYRATQLSVDRPVALKILPAEMATDEAFRKGFAMEAKAMAKLSHRNLVQLYDFGETNGIFWMIQEWVAGRTIFEVLHDEEQFAPKEAAALVAQACEGLGYAHQQGIVHRDVKPANMMMDEEGILKLMDFGLARATLGGPEGLRAKGEARFVTEEYAAPELWDLKSVIDHRVDIFALGVLLYEALTGKRPTGTFRMPSELRPGLDKRFDDIVVRAMQRDVENRYASCGDLMVALRRVVTSTPKIKLQTSPNQITGAVSLKAPPPQPEQMATVIPVVIPAQVGMAKKKTSSRGLVLVASIALLLGALGGVWMVLTGGEKKDDAVGEESREAGNSGIGATGGSPPPRFPVTSSETGPEPIVRSNGGGSGRGSDPNPDPTPPPNSDPDPDPAPDPVPPPPPAGIAEVLKGIDAELRTSVAELFQQYVEARTDLEDKFLAECTKEEDKAVRSGDLDAVIYWQAEAQAIKSGGNPGKDDAGISTRAVVLRNAWWKRMGPRQAALEPMQSAYLEKMTEVDAAADTDAAKALVRERREKVAEFRHFVALCAGKAPPFPGGPDSGGGAGKQGGSVAEQIEGLLPEAMVSMYKTTRQRLDTLKQGGDTAEMATLIRSYGTRLVRDEKALTRQRKITAAKAVRRIKDEMLALLTGISGGGTDPGITRRSESVAVIQKGAPTDQCLYDRKEWKRKGRVLLCEGMDSDNSFYPKLKTVPSIGPGDFKVTLKMTCGRIGATSLRMLLGETYLQLDDDNGRIAMRASGAAIGRVSGANLGSLARAGAPIECVIQRRGTQLLVLVNGKEGLKATVHEREMGPVTLMAGSGRLEIEEFLLEGGLEEAPKMQRLGNTGSARWNKGMVQLLPTANQGLTALFIAWSYNDGGNELWAQRSRDGGTKWDDEYEVIDDETFEVGMTSFAAACDERRDEMFAVVATGKANQRLYVLQGRNGGRNWSKPEEITASAKKPGWNVRLASQGLVLKRNRSKTGRIVVPMHAGTESRALHMLVSDSGGREWKVIGPLTESSGGDAEIMEDEEGTLWAAVGFRHGPADHGFRMMLSSMDGGETWSDPVQSMMPDAGHHGSLAIGVDAGKKPVWYYASARPVQNANGNNYLTHLTLYFSRDKGRTWRELRRVHYGGWSHPTVVPLAPDRCGIAYLAASPRSGYEQIRFVDADRLWGE